MNNEIEGQSTVPPTYAQPPAYQQPPTYAQPPHNPDSSAYDAPQYYLPPQGNPLQQAPYPPVEPAFAQTTQMQAQPYLSSGGCCHGPQTHQAQSLDVPSHGHSVAVTVGHGHVDGYSTCCGRYNYILWGTSARRFVSALMIALAIAGLVLIIVAKRSCPSDCTEQSCIGYNNRYYDCSCGAYCKDKSASGPLASIGIALLNIGSWYFVISAFVACCCFGRYV